MLSSRLFDDDPFFPGHREHMRQMEEMFRGPFGFPPGGMLGITDGRAGQERNNSQQIQRHQHGGVLAPVGFFDFGFNNMFQNMRRMMDDMHSTFETAQANPNSHMYTQQSFMSYSNVGGGQPRIYQASSSTTQAPGGIREIRKTVRDSETGVEKIAVGRHLGERAHIEQRQRNRRTGEQEENQEYINLDEEEAPQFDREWEERTRQKRHDQGLEYRRRGERSERRQAALPAPRQKRTYRDRE